MSKAIKSKKTLFSPQSDKNSSSMTALQTLASARQQLDSARNDLSQSRQQAMASFKNTTTDPWSPYDGTGDSAKPLGTRRMVQATKTQLTAKTKKSSKLNHQDSKLSLKLPVQMSERNLLHSAREPSARFLFSTKDSTEPFSQTLNRGQIHEDKSQNRVNDNTPDNTDNVMSATQRKDTTVNDRNNTPVYTPGKNHKSQIINPKLNRQVKMPKNPSTMLRPPKNLTGGIRPQKHSLMATNSDYRQHGISTYSTRPGSQHNESQLTGLGKKSGGLTPNNAANNRGTFASSSQLAKSEISAADRDARQTGPSRENPLSMQPNHLYYGYPASQSFQNSSSKLQPTHSKDRKSWASNVKQDVEPARYRGGVLYQEPLLDHQPPHYMNKSNYFVVEKPLLDEHDHANFHPTTPMMVSSISAASRPHAKPANAPLAQKIIKKDKQSKSYMMDTNASRKKVLTTGAKIFKPQQKQETTYREKAKEEAERFFSPPVDVKDFEGADEPVACEQSIVEQVRSPNRFLRQSEYLANNDSPPGFFTDRSTSQTRAKVPYKNVTQPLWGKMMASNVQTSKAAGHTESFTPRESQRKHVFKSKSHIDFNKILDNLDKSMLENQREKNVAYPIEAKDKRPEGRRKPVNITNIEVNKNFGLSDQVGNLFADGMGCDPPRGNSPGRQTPRLHDGSKSPQKSFNRSRDASMTQGVLKLAYDKKDNSVPREAYQQLKGIKIVEVACLPAFALNNYEKTVEPSDAKLFQQHIRSPQPYRPPHELTMKRLLSDEEEDLSALDLHSPEPLAETRPSRINLTHDEYGLSPAAGAKQVRDHRRVTLLGGADSSATRNLLQLTKSSYLEAFQTNQLLSKQHKTHSVLEPLQREDPDTHRSSRRHWNDLTEKDHIGTNGLPSAKTRAERSVSKGGVRYMNASMIELKDAPLLENKSARRLQEVKNKNQQQSVKDFAFMANKLQLQHDREQQQQYRMRNLSGTGADLISPRGKYNQSVSGYMTERAGNSFIEAALMSPSTPAGKPGDMLDRKRNTSLLGSGQPRVSRQTSSLVRRLDGLASNFKIE